MKHHPDKYKTIRPDVVSAKTGSSSTGSGRQQTITSMLQSVTKYSKKDSRWIQLTRDITIFICESMIPVNIVEYPSWQKLLSRFDKRYECPSRNYFSYTSIPALYNDVRANLQDELNSLKDCNFALTMDAWSSITKSPFLVLTIHSVNSEFQLDSRILKCVYMPEDHTGIHISERVLEVLAEFNLPASYVASITTDAGSNMVVALRELRLVRLTCFGHILHNAVGDAVKDDGRATAVCRKIVAVFSFSFKKSRAFGKIQ